MNDFKRMDIMGKKVMALRSIILSVIILALLIVFLVVNKLWLDLLSDKSMFVGSNNWYSGYYIIFNCR
jgi:hypothetical protein